jgi:enamine deaminase RidA (YjgF/YER057c/UK114 family)
LVLAQAVVTNGFVYVSGQIPLEPETRKIVSEDIREQTVNFLHFRYVIVLKKMDCMYILYIFLIK